MTQQTAGSRWSVRASPRTVSKPWERQDELSSARVVHREADVRPPAGPLARYLRHFPRRRVLWNVAHQLFEVREYDPYTGLDFRVNLVYEYEAPPTSDQRAKSAEEWEALQQAEEKVGGRGIRKVFRPFDDEYVDLRIADDYYTRHEGSGAVSRRVKRHNEALMRKRELERRDRIESWMKDDRRWLPVLAAMQDGKRKSIALVEKVPLITPGISLSGHP